MIAKNSFFERRPARTKFTARWLWMGMLSLSFLLGCIGGQIAFAPEICEIAVRDVRRSVELDRVTDRRVIADVMGILRARRESRSLSNYGGTLPAGRFNFLLYACNGPVQQLAMGINFLVDYEARRVYALAPEEKTKLRKLLRLRF